MIVLIFLWRGGYMAGGTAVTINNSQIVENVAYNGGGILIM